MMDSFKRKSGLVKWNRKIHIYLGLLLLLFMWLFAFSGLQLNHHWKFAEFWKNRKEISYDRTIQISDERGQYALVHEIQEKLDLDGSIINMRFLKDSVYLSFIITQPGTRYDIKANLVNGNTTINEMKFNQWGIMRALHVARNPTSKEQDERYPTLTASIWSFSIDVLSLGLIVICLGGIYMWLRGSKKRFYLGLISLMSGLVLCAYFFLS